MKTLIALAALIAAFTVHAETKYECENNVVVWTQDNYVSVHTTNGNIYSGTTVSYPNTDFYMLYLVNGAVIKGMSTGRESELPDTIMLTFGHWTKEGEHIKQIMVEVSQGNHSMLYVECKESK